MTLRSTTFVAAAALVLAGLSAPVSAQEAGAVHGVKTVGAMTLATRGVATSAAAVRRQGGFATAGTVDWTRAAAERQVEAGAAYGGSVGALQQETLGLATAPAEVRRQGGAMTAGAVRWASAPAQE